MPFADARVSLRWLLAVVIAAFIGLHSPAADPPEKPSANEGQVMPEAIEIIVEKEVPAPDIASGVFNDADDTPNVQQVLERLKRQARPDAVERAALRRRQIAGRAAELSRMFEPLMHLELAWARQSFPGLSPEARQAVLADSRQSLKPIAVTAATAMVTEPSKPYGHVVRRSIHDAVAAALRDHADPEAFAQYAKEYERRWARRQEAARLRIVLVLDDTLDLNTAQRSAVLAELSAGWHDSWMTVLDENSNRIIDGRAIAPDFARACIEPHLKVRQKREWSAWCEVAGHDGRGVTWHFSWGGEPRAQPDPWWNP